MCIYIYTHVCIHVCIMYTCMHNVYIYIHISTMIKYDQRIRMYHGFGSCCIRKFILELPYSFEEKAPVGGTNTVRILSNTCCALSCSILQHLAHRFMVGSHGSEPRSICGRSVAWLQLIRWTKPVIPSCFDSCLRDRRIDHLRLPFNVFFAFVILSNSL